MGGMGGVVGLDYGPLFVLMDKQGLAGDAWAYMFDDIQTLEAAAVQTINKPRS
jgi:hypothetical protein